MKITLFLIYAAYSADGLVLVFTAKVDAAGQLVKGLARGAGDSYIPPAEASRWRGGGTACECIACERVSLSG